jgi:AraC-like DNA-binding protein
MPHPRLRGIVRDPYTGWTESTSFRRPEVAYPGIVMILNFEPGLRIHDPRRASSVEVRSFVAGLHDSWVMTESGGMSHGVQVNLTPLGAHQLFGLSMHELTNGVFGLDDVLGAAGRDLTARLEDAPDWASRFDILDAFMSERLQHARAPSTEVTHAWSRLLLSAGQLRIGDLTRELGWSRQLLITRFREEIGMPPKTIARILRFDHAVRRLKQIGVVRWTDLALSCGYYDQAHMIREFGEFAGASPTVFARRVLPTIVAWADGATGEDATPPVAGAA